MLIVRNLCIFALLIGTAAVFGTGADGGTLVVSPTFLNYPHPITAIGRAGGALIREGRAGVFAIAHSDDPAFPTLLRQAGAMFAVQTARGETCLSIKSPE